MTAMTTRKRTGKKPPNDPVRAFIGNINEDGYLRATADEISEMTEGAARWLARSFGVEPATASILPFLLAGHGIEQPDELDPFYVSP